VKNLSTLLKEQAYRALYQLLGRSTEPEIFPVAQAELGHYQCNNALKLAKECRKSPKEIAHLIIEAWKKVLLPEEKLMIDRMEIGGAGFVNIFLNPSFLSEQIMQLLQDLHLGVSLPSRRERVIVEFSSPNVAKELHVGHLRSTLIGDALARLFEFLGHDVLRLNHLGDWGTQFGMLIEYLEEKVPRVLEEKAEVRATSLMKWYQESKILFDQDQEFKSRAQRQVVQLQRGEPRALLWWKIICDISRRSFQEIYDLLDVQVLERGESSYNPHLPEIVADLERKNLIILSQGAKCFYLEGFTGRGGELLPMIVQKSDGGYNYSTTDLAALRNRIEEEKGDRIVYVTDTGQSLHLEMIFRACEKAGYLDPKKVRVDHVSFGLVLGPDGKKFKTRSGKTEKLIDLLLEAIHRAKLLLVDRLLELSDEELERQAKVLGIDAIKYADLSSNRIKDYHFSYEKMLCFKGNTAPFLLYAYVRIQSIKKRLGKEIGVLLNTTFIVLEDPAEVILALHLRQFGEAIELVLAGLFPHRLAEYLYLLAEKFHQFFHQCHVEGSPKENSRLLLCEATGRILKQGLEILGLKTLDQM